MKISWVLSLLIFILSLSFIGCSHEETETATIGEIKVSVAESIYPLIEKETAEFERRYPQSKILLQSSTTRGTIVSLLNDSTGIIVCDRMLNEEEQKIATRAGMKLQMIRIAEDAIAIIVNQANFLQHISKEVLVKILTKQMTQWNEIPVSGLDGEIQLVITGKNSGIYEILAEHLLKKNIEISPMLVANSQKQVLDYVTKNQSAIGLISYASCHFETETGDSLAKDVMPVRILSISGVDSLGQETSFKLHQANIYLGRYPLHYPVYVLLNPEKSRLGIGFSAFITSAPGQKIILNWGLVPVTQPVRLVQLNREDLEK